MPKTYTGSCHCGAVRFEVDMDFASGTSKCNCTSCWKRRWWSVRVTPAGFRPLSGKELLSKEGGFCTKCGIVPYGHVPKSDWNESEYYSVNVAALDDLDPRELMAAPIQLCDGRNDNWWNAPEYTAHL